MANAPPANPYTSNNNTRNIGLAPSTIRSRRDEIANNNARNIGLAQSTINRDETAKKCYNYVNRMYGAASVKPFEQLNATDIESDLVELVLGEYAYLLKNHPIPKGWARGPGHSWEEQDDPKRLSTDAMMKHFEPLFSMPQSRFPNHPFLIGLAEHQQWWCNLKGQLKKGLDKGKQRGDEEALEPNCKALCIVNQPRLTRCTTDHMMDDLDLLCVIKSLIRNASALNLTN